MAFGKNVQFVLSANNLGTPQPGSDYISGILFAASSIPSGFASGVSKKVFSVTQAESLGIVGDYSDETKATATLTVTGTASSGNTFTFTVAEPYIYGATNTVTIGTYEATATLSNIDLASRLAIAINTSGSGYSAATSSNTITVSARTGLGSLINTIGITKSGTGASLVSGGTFSTGVSSQRVVEHYQVSEYFRTNINGALWVTYTSVSPDWDILNSIQAQANGEIRQLGAYNIQATLNSTITSDLDAIQAACENISDSYSPMSVLYAPNLIAYSDMSLLPDLTQRSDYFVSCVIGQDGDGLGAYLALYSGSSVPCYGAALGLVSKAPVSDNIGWVGKYPISTGTELALPAFSNKQKYSTLWSDQYALLDQLNNSSYIFLMSRPGIGGTWVNDTWTAVSRQSDFNSIERVRTIFKVLRESYKALVPLVNSALLLQADGTISPETVEIFRNSQAPNLNQMVSNAEISAYSIIIDPTQNVQSTSTIKIIVRIVGIGVARNIVVDLGYALSI